MFTQEEIQMYRDRIVVEAKKFYKVPYCHRGSGKLGIDCRGLPSAAYRKAGLKNIPEGDGKIYQLNWYQFTNEERYLNFLLKYCEFTDIPQKGDLIVFKCIRHCNLVTHAGIVLDNPKDFIHSRSGSCVEIDNVERKLWKSTFAGYLVYKPFIGKEIDKELIK